MTILHILLVLVAVIISITDWRAVFQWIRFGKITEKVMARDGGQISEIAFIGRGGKCVGYWAYGEYDPMFPYQGPKK